jgi:hypothetical protein
MFERIIILVDGSDADRVALEYGIGLARSVGAQLHVVGVVELPMASTGIDEIKDIEDERRFVLDRALRGAREQASAAGQPITTEVIFGPLVETVSRAIQARTINLLVIGATGEAFGRNYRSLAMRAPCPVFVARESVVQEFLGAPERREEHWEVRRDRRERIEGRGLMLEVFVGEADTEQGRPIYELIVERLRQIDVAGATVFAGEVGFGASRHLHPPARRPWSHDRPMVITVVDYEGAIRVAIEAMRDLVTHALVVTSVVDVIKYAHRPGAPVATS